LSCIKVTSLYVVAPEVATDKCLKLYFAGKLFYVVWYTSSSKTLVHFVTNNITSHMLYDASQIIPKPQYII